MRLAPRDVFPKSWKALQHRDEIAADRSGVREHDEVGHVFDRHRREALGSEVFEGRLEDLLDEPLATDLRSRRCTPALQHIRDHSGVSR